MSGCQCKTGFFALRDCTEPVVTQCAHCKRAICSRHRTSVQSGTVCLDCAAGMRQAQARKDTPAQRERRRQDAALDDTWVYGYRDQHYRSGYAPIYSGTRDSTYYDQYDQRAFDQLPAERDDPDADHGVGFHDS